VTWLGQKKGLNLNKLQVMKWSFICLLLILNGVTIQAQLPPWITKFIVYHPDGYTDTLWIGCDENATDGYDEGFDIIDTTFQYPLAIRGYSEEIENDSAFGNCVNLIKDVKGFDNPAIFTFYVLHDEITGTGFPAQIGWDTTDFKYGYEDYKIDQAYLASEFGYVGGIDATFWLIMNRNNEDTSDISFPTQPIDIVPENSVYECSPQHYIVKVTATVFFADYTVNINERDFKGKVYPNPVTEKLFIETSSQQPFLYRMSDLSGRTILHSSNLSYRNAEIEISGLYEGLYILELISTEGNILYASRIIKLNTL
jgi:Secretion system C-terminal sorting domain